MAARSSSIARASLCHSSTKPEGRLAAAARTALCEEKRGGGRAGDALRTLAHEPANFVVTDFAMPEMNGAELCRRLRCQPVFAQLPIVLMSAAPEPTVGPPSWTLYLRKPVDLSALLRAPDCFVAHRLSATPGTNTSQTGLPGAGSGSTPLLSLVMSGPGELMLRNSTNGAECCTAIAVPLRERAGRECAGSRAVPRRPLYARINAAIVAMAAPAWLVGEAMRGWHRDDIRARSGTARIPWTAHG